MTKEVLVTISGLQYELNESEALEVITPGEYYCKNGKHYVLYEEVLEADQAFTKNTLKISEKQIDLIRKGPVNVHMVFEENNCNMTYYNTPYGDLIIGVNTHKITTTEEEELITVEIQYGLEVNNSHVSDCTIKIMIKPRMKRFL